MSYLVLYFVISNREMLKTMFEREYYSKGYIGYFMVINPALKYQVLYGYKRIRSNGHFWSTGLVVWLNKFCRQVFIPKESLVPRD